jgi:phosphate:Na+ symporter
VFFLGINVLQSGFADVSNHLSRADFADSGWLTSFGFIGLGLLLTVVTQSSSAAIALVLTASASGSIPLHLAAAAVIGTNIGTTSTAVFAALNATPAAKRVAGAHILFNLLTALAALVLFIPLLLTSRFLASFIAGEGDQPAILAIFHTLFNCLGVVLIWPLTGGLVRFLKTRFVSPIERLAEPAHLDSTLLSVPSLALRGLVLEVTRMSNAALRLARRRIETLSAETLGHEHGAVLQLGQAIRDYVSRLGASPLSEEIVKALPDLIRSIQHVEDLATTSQELTGPYASDPNWVALRDAVLAHLRPDERASDGAETAFESLLLHVEDAYRQAKTSLLHAAAIGALPVGLMEEQLSQAQVLRRCAEAAIKARRRLSPWVVLVNGVSGEAPPNRK